MKDKIQDKYRHVFLNSEMGLEVLGDILGMCHFGCSLDSDIKMHEHNVGIAVLNKCGVFGKGTFPQVLKAFTAIMPEQENENEG